MTPLPRRPPLPAPSDDLRVRWGRSSADFGAVADGLSLLMPHLEPLAITAARDTLRSAAPGAVDPALRAGATAWVRQEGAHQAAHRRYNRALTASSRGLRLVDSVAAAVARFLARRRLGFRLAFTVGFEAVAYAVARWVEPRMAELFAGCEPATASLFLWHLAEEVEHKSVVHDLHVAIGARSGARFAGGLAALLVIAPLTIAGAVVSLFQARRLRRPATWWHLASWSLSFSFSALTAVGMLAVGGHGPADLADPLWYRQFLRGVDPASGRLAPWVPPAGPGTQLSGVGPGFRGPHRSVGSVGVDQGRESRVSKGPVTS